MEIVFALSILVGVGGTILLATQSLSSAFRTGTSLATLDTQARSGLDRVAEILEQAGADTLGAPSSDPFSGEDEIVYQRAIGFADGVIQYGPIERIRVEPSPADPADGVDNDGNGLVDEGQIVWVERDGSPDERRHVLVRHVARTAEGEVAGNGVDDNGNGITDEGGFSLVWDTETITVRITLEGSVTSAVTMRRTFERTVGFLNGGG